MQRQTQLLALSFLLVSCIHQHEKVVTVTGEISPDKMGICLAHEHLLVDFQRTKEGTPDFYTESEAVARILPELNKLKAHGVQTIAECTPAYLGRNIELLRKLSTTSGIQFITNTGFYGARNNRFIPKEVLLMTADSIASIWTTESKQGIENSGVKPGFIKIGVDRKPLSEFHARLTRAAAITHKKTGLTIMSHCGPAIAALQQLDILDEEGVSPQAFIWTHASDEKDWDLLLKAASKGCWISLDKYGWKAETDSVYPNLISRFKQEGLLDHILISQDAGFFDPGQPEANFKNYTTIFKKLVPKLRDLGFSPEDINQLFIKNPAKAFTVCKRLN